MKYIYILIIFFAPMTTMGQENSKKATKLYERGSYADASIEFDNYIATSPSISGDTWLQIADTRYNLHDNERALVAYEKAFTKLRYTMSPNHIWQYYDVMRTLKKYDAADDLYINYLKSIEAQDKLNSYYEEQARFNDALKNDTLYTITNLDINSKYSDFGGTFNGNEFIFSSARNANENDTYERDNSPFLSLYKADRIASTQFVDVRFFSEDLEGDYHDATPSFSPDGKFLYFSSNEQSGISKAFSGKRANFFNLFRAWKDGDSYKKEMLPINGKEYSTGHPYVSADGKWLFFASDMPGGYGQADIYVCQIFEDNTLSRPKNLGPNINTDQDDFFPFFRDGTLYFSSRGHAGFGGLDIYKSYLKNDVYSTPINLGPVINSNADDFAYLQSDKKNQGYFTSNRSDGKGSDDIYAFDYNLQECNQIVTGTTYDEETGEPIVGVTIKIYDDKKNVVAEMLTDAQGMYKVNLTCSTYYLIEATKKDFEKDFLQITTGREPNGIIDLVDLRLLNLSTIFETDGEVTKIRMEPIHFEYHRYDINPFAARQLQRIIKVMNRFPDMIIKIEAHTDQRGSDSYNQTLSDGRAKATRDFLIESGIDASRITSAIGYGESRPINICDEEGGCSEVEYLENRRSEFIVVSR